ncbi:hypothetical protein BC831DRAFT_472302 [Entophlyctis helioformis]|nr:hypothetical protein BC831DRAFT_472302 [Entophlyctis helioformis]
MGRQHNNKKGRGGQRSNPILPTAAAAAASAASTAPDAPAAPAADQAKPAGALPVLGKLKSADPSERAWAATTLSHFVQDAALRKQLLSANLFGLLFPLLADTHANVVLEVLGTLHNLLIAGGDDMAADLVRSGLLPLMLACFGNVAAQVHRAIADGGHSAAAAPRPVRATPRSAPMSMEMEDGSVVKSDEDDDKVSPFALAEHAMGVLWSLGEGSNDVVKALSMADVVAFAMAMLDPAHAALVPLSLVVVSGQFLNMLTDNNPEVHPFFVSTPAYAECLMSYVTGGIPGYDVWDDNRLQVPMLAACILENLRLALIELSDVARTTEFYNAILGAVSRVLDLDIAAQVDGIVAAGAAVDAIEASQAAKAAAQGGESFDGIGIVENKDSQRIKLFSSQLETVQLGLEILTNIYSEDMQDGGEPWQDADADDDEDEDGEAGADDLDDEMFEDMGMVAGDESGNPTGASESPDHHVASLSAALFAPPTTIFPKLVRFATLHVPTRPAPGASAALDAVAHVRTVQTRAVACISNMALVGYLGEWSVQRAGEFVELWDRLFAFVVAASSSSTTKADLESLEGTMALLWSLTNMVTGKTSPRLAPRDDVVQWLLQAIQPTSGAPAPLRAKPNRLALMARLASTPTEDAAVLCEVLNALYDIYADAAFDYDAPVFVAGGFLAHLQTAYPAVRSRFRGIDKRRDRALRDRADEMLLNLRAFITYKAGERK